MDKKWPVTENIVAMWTFTVNIRYDEFLDLMDSVRMFGWFSIRLNVKKKKKKHLQQTVLYVPRLGQTFAATQLNGSNWAYMWASWEKQVKIINTNSTSWEDFLQTFAWRYIDASLLWSFLVNAGKAKHIHTAIQHHQNSVLRTFGVPLIVTIGQNGM